MSIRYDIMETLRSEAQKIMTDANYPVTVQEISDFDLNVTTQDSFKTPLLMIGDTGVETLEVENGGKQRFSLELMFRIFVKADTKDNLWEALNNGIAVVKKFVNSDPALHSQALALLYVSSRINRFDKDTVAADAIIDARLVYWSTVGTY